MMTRPGESKNVLNLVIFFSNMILPQENRNMFKFNYLFWVFQWNLRPYQTCVCQWNVCGWHYCNTKTETYFDILFLNQIFTSNILLLFKSTNMIQLFCQKQVFQWNLRLQHVIATSYVNICHTFPVSHMLLILFSMSHFYQISVSKLQPAIS